jgi:RimJ/RimL family protein N-acetyltransferase
MTLEDAGFVRELVNEPEFMKHIGDKGVRTLDDARTYIRDVPVSAYAAHGYGGYLVRLRDDGMPIGICGLYKRPNLEHPDLGFALMQAHFGQGYARESAEGVIHHARSDLGIQQIAAIVSPGNTRSIRLLSKLGFERWGSCRMPDQEELLYYYRMFLQG